MTTPAFAMPYAPSPTAAFAAPVDAMLIMFPLRFSIMTFATAWLTIAAAVSAGGYEDPLAEQELTEILVRPLFSLFFPALPGLIQPLAGEYAVRREVLEAIPFPIGYGVETAMLIDIYERLGLYAFAQTDLDKRIHRNQETIALGRMAFGVLRTFMSRLKDRDLVQFQDELPAIMRQYEVSEGDYRQIEYNIEEFERPPIIELDAYRHKFHPEGAPA